MNEIDSLKNEFYSILELMRKEMDEIKEELHLFKEKEADKEMKEYNKLLSNYVPLKEKTPIKIKVIQGVEYIIDNNILFNELGEIVGKINEKDDKNNDKSDNNIDENEITWI